MLGRGQSGFPLGGWTLQAVGTPHLPPPGQPESAERAGQVQVLDRAPPAREPAGEEHTGERQGAETPVAGADRPRAGPVEVAADPIERAKAAIAARKEREAFLAGELGVEWDPDAAGIAKAKQAMALQRAAREQNRSRELPGHERGLER